MLILVPPDKGEESASLLSSAFHSTTSDSISIRIFVKKFYMCYLYSVLLDIQIPHCCLLQEAHMGQQVMFPRLP